MSLTLLSIGETDLTEYIDIQNYEVNKVPVYEEWVDGNHITHRSLIRKKITGSFKVGFRKSDDVAAFLALLSENIQTGQYYEDALVYTNNDDTLNTADIFLEGTAAISRDLVNNRVWHEYTITVEER